MEKEGMFWSKIGNKVRCELCPHFCVLAKGEVGKCGARENINNKLASLSYSRLCSLAIDPIEKKPLYHFLPGSKTLSIASPGCNLKCKHCQNWQISQAKVRTIEMSPEQVIKEAKKDKIKIISYTFTEPTTFYEYMLDIAKLARKSRMKNVLVTNGFINPEPLRELLKYIDGVNVDLKGDDEFYQKICDGKLKPVLDSIKLIYDSGAWLEITNLLIPGLNDSHEQISRLAEFVAKLDKNIPLHFSAFFPCYKLGNLKSTTIETLRSARNIAKAKGLSYVYTGNVNESNDTYCPRCNKLLTKRDYFYHNENKLKKGKCSCKQEIAGVWQ
ncbi:MAG: AmmeMemoRadiSam system radical SAM enzyme [Candidatus Pacearchaeota archaeon]|nr:AmmeMemoRadiSam system radical SAM enzyme [Candidatus Pacearchaeota archaeon]